MSQNIHAVHEALVTLVEGLAITSPTATSVKHVWPYSPPSRVTMETPGAILNHDLTDVRFVPGGAVQQDYDMHLQFFVAPASTEQNVAMEMANEFLDALVTALSGAVRLGGAVQMVRGLRGAQAGQGTITLLQWSNQGFVGLDLVIPITLIDTRTRAA